tara:strand:+ start:1964 stop:2152 length:189 start_codon:yes stop_codon:yes gene_type:complete
MAKTTPFSGIDIIIQSGHGIVFVERIIPIFSWVNTDGFVSYEGSLEDAAPAAAAAKHSRKKD